MKRRLDENDSEITRALRDAGALVWHLDCVEPGRPDKLVAFLGRISLLEVKRSKGGRLSAEQRAAHAALAAHGVRVHVVRSIREALDAVGIGATHDQRRREGLGEVAGALRRKSDEFEARSGRLVPAQHDYRDLHGGDRSKEKTRSSAWGEIWDRPVKIPDRV